MILVGEKCQSDHQPGLICEYFEPKFLEEQSNLINLGKQADGNDYSADHDISTRLINPAIWKEEKIVFLKNGNPQNGWFSTVHD